MKKLIEKIGYNFKDENLLKTALTHSSYANEHKVESYERLEFFGDSILSYIVSEYIYKHFKELPEGGLSKLRSAIVCERSLEQIAIELGIGNYLLLSKGEDMTGGRTRPSILADVFESILAAIYLDGGLQPATDFVLRELSDDIENARKGKSVFKDYKTQLQEFVQQKDMRASYTQLEESGPEHNKVFKVSVSVNDKFIAYGTGRNKKEAEQNAAMNGLRKLRGNSNE